jgi:HD superfamily phosphodiesterase
MALKLARRLVEEAGGDESVVLAAVILHDVGYAKTKLKWTQAPGSELPEHMVEGARLAGELMEGAGFNSSLSEEVCFAVLNHDLLKGDLLREASLSVKLAVEADRLAGLATLYGVKTLSRLKGRSPLEVLSTFESKMNELLATEEAKRMAQRMIAELRRKMSEAVGEKQS